MRLLQLWGQIKDGIVRSQIQDVTGVQKCADHVHQRDALNLFAFRSHLECNFAVNFEVQHVITKFLQR